MNQIISNATGNHFFDAQKFNDNKKKQKTIIKLF